MDIPKEYCDETQTAMVDKLLASPSASHFSPFLFTGDGPYLRRNTWLNDSIVQCYTAVLNFITEETKRCIFLGPFTSHGWDDQEILQNLNNYYAECQDSIEFGLPLPDPLSFNNKMDQVVGFINAVLWKSLL